MFDYEDYAKDYAEHLGWTADVSVDGWVENPFQVIAEPPAGTLAAIEFQVASLLNDHLSTVNWQGREPLVVNEPGSLFKKLGTLRRIARANFPSRGDLDDVLNQTIDDYGLWKWANPSGFWTAFKHDMIDAKRASFEAKRGYLEKATRNSSDGTRPERNSYNWTPSREAQIIDEQSARKWLAESRDERNADLLWSKWRRVKASGNPGDRLIVEAVSLALADAAYVEGLAHTERGVAKLTRLVAEIRSLTNCSQAEAYRLLTAFKRRYSFRPKKI